MTTISETTISEQGARGLGALAAQAERLIAEVEDAARALADAVQVEQRLEAGHALLKAAVAQSLLGQPNPQTGKPHSASSAGDAAQLSEAVTLHRQEVINAVRAKIIAQGAYEGAKLRARLSVVAVECGGEP